MSYSRMGYTGASTTILSTPLVSAKIRNNFVNHVCLVLDRSLSMSRHEQALVQAADLQIAHLAAKSQEMDQETRITVISFGDTAEVLVWDMDVMRLPSIKELYKISGNTALATATTLALDDLAEIPTKHGDHSFLIFVLTDGQENRSPHEVRQILPHRVSALAENWTVAFLVPNVLAQRDVHETVRIPKGNIALWDTTSADGAVEAGATIRDATDRFLEGRLRGDRGMGAAVFSTSTDAVNKGTIAAAALTPLSPNNYLMLPVTEKVQIRSHVLTHGHQYVSGRAYYELSKRESIQPQKSVAVVDRKTGQVYTGPQARRILGLPDMEVKVRPDYNPDYKIFIQSTSVNRNLVAGTQLLWMLR